MDKQQKLVKSVLTVDDHETMRYTLIEEFGFRSEEPEFPYRFEVDEARSANEGIRMVRSKQYDIVVLDIAMEVVKSGLDLACSITEQFGYQLPIKIIFSGNATEIPNCVEAMRGGAWDYIIKEKRNGIIAPRRVVNSAVTRLRQMDLRGELEAVIVREWLPTGYRLLDKNYAGKFVALWHEPNVDVIASGVDAFDLDQRIKESEWRQKHTEEWMLPYIMQIPEAPKSRSVESAT